MTDTPQARAVVVGGGFAGVACAVPQALDRSGTPRMTWDEDEIDPRAAASAATT